MMKEMVTKHLAPKMKMKKTRLGHPNQIYKQIMGKPFPRLGSKEDRMLKHKTKGKKVGKSERAQILTVCM